MTFEEETTAEMIAGTEEVGMTEERGILIGIETDVEGVGQENDTEMTEEEIDIEGTVDQGLLIEEDVDMTTMNKDNFN